MSRSAGQLGVADWEHAGLVAFLAAVRAGRVVPHRVDGPPVPRGSCALDMGVGCTHCGTVCCIGGFVALHSGMVPRDADRYARLLPQSSRLRPLYYPPHIYNHRNPREAAAVVRRFLRSGVVRWP
jgi:hypothetical protein